MVECDSLILDFFAVKLHDSFNLFACIGLIALLISFQCSSGSSYYSINLYILSKSFLDYRFSNYYLTVLWLPLVYVIMLPLLSQILLTWVFTLLANYLLSFLSFPRNNPLLQSFLLHYVSLQFLSFYNMIIIFSFY